MVMTYIKRLGVAARCLDNIDGTEPRVFLCTRGREDDNDDDDDDAGTVQIVITELQRFF